MKIIHMYYETAELKAYGEIFGYDKIRGCSFYYNQTLHNVKKIKLFTYYRENKTNKYLIIRKIDSILDGISIFTLSYAAYIANRIV